MAETQVACSECGGINGLPPSRRANDAKCGLCGIKLFTAHPKDISGWGFDHHFGRSTLPALGDVWAPWCGPCKTIAPAFEAAARELGPRVVLGKLNSDSEQAISADLGIRSIPTMILFSGGKAVARTSGAMSAGQIVSSGRDRLPSVAA